MVVFESEGPDGWEADLLDLRDQDAIVTVKDNIPAGHYSKIRLRVADIQVIGGEDTPCSADDIEIMLPSGKIDLNPKGGFEVVPGGTIAIRLDIDCDKSIQLHPTGKYGKCIFRPVVFVEVDTLDAIDDCPRVTKGIIETIEDDDTAFTLLLGEGRGPLTVVLADGVVIFGENGMPATADQLEPGQLVHVRGQLDNDGNLQASVIVIGRVVLIKGMVATPYDDEGLFTLNLMPPHAFAGDTVAVDVSDDTLVLTACDQMADATDIQAGMMARVVGKLSLEDQSIKAIAVLLKDVTVAGTLDEVLGPNDAGGYMLFVEVADAETVEIYMPAGVEPYTEDPLDPENPVPVSIDDLKALTGCGQMLGVSIIVKSKDVSPMIASDVRVDAITVEDNVVALADDNGALKVTLSGGEIVAVPPTAIINPVDGAISENDEVTVIGLEACDGDAYDYLAYMVIIQQEP